MLRSSAPIRTALSSVGKRFQSARAAQAGWQQMVQEAQQGIKGTASVRATSRVEDAAAPAEHTVPAPRGTPCATTSAFEWKQMMQAANKIEGTPSTKEEAKVTVKTGGASVSM